MSQIAEKKFPHAMLLGGLSVNLNHLKTREAFQYLVMELCSENLILHFILLGGIKSVKLATIYIKVRAEG